MSFLLAEAPGFTDIPDSLTAAPSAFATGFLMSAIKDDCAAGTVMPEFFQGFYTNGQVVPPPTSTVDGYLYQQQEIMYVWECVNTTNMSNGLPSANGGLLWMQHNVDQRSGAVSCTEAYYVPGGAQTNTNDGVLKVTTIAVRGKQLRKMTSTITGSLTSGMFQLGERLIQTTSGATAYVDSGSSLPGDYIPGGLTSGTFTLGETATQTGTGATVVVAYPPPGSDGPMYTGVGTGTPNATSIWTGNTSGAVFTPAALPVDIPLTVLQAVMGVATATNVWTGQTSGATYTPTALPSPFAFKYYISGALGSGIFSNGEVVQQAVTDAQAILTRWPDTSVGDRLFVLGPITGSTPPDNSHTWSGLSSGATWNPTGYPVFITSRYTDLSANTWPADGPLGQTAVRDLVNNARLSTVRMECFLLNPSGAATWQPNTSYTEGQLIQPSGRWANGCWYVCALSGISGSLEPGPWPSELTETQPVADGSTLWNIAGAGFTYGQQVPLPVSPFDGYEYNQEEIYVVMPFFITTLALPIQKGIDIVWTSGRGDARAFAKNIVSTQPANPSYLPAGTAPADVTGATVYTQWNASNPNAAYYLVPGAVTLGTFHAPGEVVIQNISLASAFMSPPPQNSPYGGQLTLANPITGTADVSDIWVGQTSGAQFTPTGTPVAAGSAEIHEPALLSPTTPTTGCGIVYNSVFFQDGAYSDGALNVLVIACRALTPGNPTTFTLTAAAAGGVYTGTITGGGGNFYAGYSFTITGFAASSGANNGTYKCTASTALTLTLSNSNAVNETHSGSAAFVTMAAPGGATYTDFETDDVLSGEPLPTLLMTEMNENAKFAILRPEAEVEFTVGPGTIVPSFTSPWDGYLYETSEEQFLEWWTNTGAAPGDLRDFSLQINPQTGVCQTRTDYYRGAGWSVPLTFGLITFGSGSSIATAMYGYPGSPVYSNMPSTGTWGIPTVNVAILASRQAEVEQQNVTLIATPGNTSPAPPGSGNLLPDAGFELWSEPGNTAIATAGVADDWYTDENVGTTAFSQEAGLLPGSTYAQGIGAKYTASTLAGRSANPVNRASVQSMRVPIDPTGTYAFAFVAQASPQVINYGFYCRIHLLDNNLSNDTQFELLWPGQTLADIPGSITLGTFLVGEQIIQNGSGGAVTYCAANTAPLQLFGGVVGVPDATDIWVGQVSGAHFTPSAVPTLSATGDEGNPPGTTIGNNYGSPLNTTVQVFGNPPYVFQIPQSGVSSASTNFGASVLNQSGTPVTLGFIPAYLYVEFDLWSPMNNGGGPGGTGMMFAIVDNCVLTNVTGVQAVSPSGGGIVVGDGGYNPGGRGRPISPLYGNTAGSTALYSIKGVGDPQTLSLDTEISDGPTTFWRVGSVNTSNLITAPSHASQAVNIRNFTTFSSVAVNGTVATVATMSLATGTNAGDLVYFGFNLSNVTTSYANNYFIYAIVSYAGAAGSTQIFIDYLFGIGFGSVILQAGASASTTATLSIALVGGPSSGTVSGSFYVGNQQNR